MKKALNKSRLFLSINFLFLLTACLIQKPATTNWESSVVHIDKTITDFMKKNKVPGASVAIVKDGRLVFARGYGYADERKKEKVSTSSLFRIASISKPITSVAIMKLIEEGRLKLNDKVFGDGALLGTEYGSLPYSNNEKAITIQQLLEHTAGGKTWNNRRGNDPMFLQQDMNFKELIGWVLDTRDPDETPGTSYSYSNFGYCVLGRVIEKITNESYESYVQNKILKPMGITAMRLGGDTRAERYPKEVLYKDEDENPYSIKVRRMDAHGGWIASAVDLTRFMVHVDGFSTKADFLKSKSINTMTRPSTVNDNYAKGWSVNSKNDWYHNGGLPGSRTILTRTNDGFCWAFLVNTGIETSLFSDDVDDIMWDLVNGVGLWTNNDLF